MSLMLMAERASSVRTRSSDFAYSACQTPEPGKRFAASDRQRVFDRWYGDATCWGRASRVVTDAGLTGPAIGVGGSLSPEANRLFRTAIVSDCIT